MGRLKSSLKTGIARISPELARSAVQANRFLQRKIRQMRPERVDESYFYPQQQDCQIPYLAHLYALFLGERENGIFVEIGANDGVLVSNTWGLAARRWTGVMAEPVPSLAEACRRNHRQHPGVVVVETAVGDGSHAQITLSLAGAFTTANPELNREYGTIEWSSFEQTGREIVVKAQTLDNLLTEQGVAPDFDVLVVDVEGFETAVFSGFSLTQWRPRMMIIELADTHPKFSTTRVADAHLGHSLIQAGYVVVFKDAVNTVFVRDDIWSAAFVA